MNYESVYNDIIAIVYGDTDPPDSVQDRLYGSEGLIARKCRKIMKDYNYWFMETSMRLPIINGISSYNLPLNFKEEHRLRFEDISTGDYHTPLKKLSLDEIETSYKDRDREEYYPSRYYIDFNSDTDRRKLTLYYKPKGYTDYYTTLSATDTSIASTAFSYQIDGEEYEADAVTAGTAFSVADTINASAAVSELWGVWTLQIDDEGTISTKSPDTDQTYETEEEALLDRPEADEGCYPMGYVTIQNNASATWTANTDDLTAGSDCNAVNFYSVVSILNIRYFKYLDDLSDVEATFEAYEDMISKKCPDLLIWMCVKDLAQIRYDSGMVQMAMNEINENKNELIRKDWHYRTANAERIPARVI